MTSLSLQVRAQVLDVQLNEARVAASKAAPLRRDNSVDLTRAREETENALAMNQKLEEELSKRDVLIEVCIKISGYRFSFKFQHD